MRKTQLAISQLLMTCASYSSGKTNVDLVDMPQLCSDQELKKNNPPGFRHNRGFTFILNEWADVT